MDLRKYIYGHCVHPKKVRIYDSYSKSYIVRLLPCGKCLHCRNTHISEWVTRLVSERKYHTYIYYVSLDYAPFKISDPVALKLARETAACYHNINKNHTYGMHPLVLCKNHLQDFFKRLRKRTNLKLQYFSCGEYGMHANGRGYGRPHFHNIIFSDSPISQDDFVSAWTIDGYTIGRVDFCDLSPVTLGDNNQINIFKYVCKYLQKSSFNFDDLATIDFHRAYFRSIATYIKLPDNLFETAQELPITDKQILCEKWSEYCKLYSPFVVCSRRPSIGSSYFADNLERFKAQDFRLFGLPDICSTFPRYFIRRTKESLYNFSCIGEVSQKPSSSSRMGYIIQVLSDLYSARLDISSWNKDSFNTWCVSKIGDLGLCIKLYNRKFEKCSSFNFYDVNNKFLYQFNGYHYNVWAKLSNCYTLLDTMDIIDVLHEISPSWDNYYNKMIKPLHDIQVLREKDLYNSINCLYPPKGNMSSYDQFLAEIDCVYQAELNDLYKTKLLMSNSKLTL